MLSFWHSFVSLFLPLFKRGFRLKKKKQMPFVARKRRLSVRTVKAAGLAFTGAKRTALTEEAGREAHSYGRKGTGVGWPCNVSHSRGDVKEAAKLPGAGISPSRA
jgi:hypothetical protein